MDLAALNASLPDKITKEEINDLPLARYEGPIHLVKDPQSVPAALREIRKNAIVGFDTETRPVFKKGQSFPTALIQMAGEDAVWLFQLNRLNGIEEIAKILADPSVLKVGVALRDDFIKLRELYEFQEEGVVDIASMTQQLDIVNTGLRSLCAIFLKFRISKAAQVSNWGKQDLSESQLIYAATDAWASRQLFLHLHQQGVPYQTNEER